MRKRMQVFRGANVNESDDKSLYSKRKQTVCLRQKRRAANEDFIQGPDQDG